MSRPLFALGMIITVAAFVWSWPAAHGASQPAPVRPVVVPMTPPPPPPPPPAPTPTVPTMLAAGTAFTCSLAGGVVRCWGSQRFGQLGEAAGPVGRGRHHASIVVPHLPPARGLWAGTFHACAADEAGALFCWGHGGYHQLGNVDTADHPRPVRVALPGGSPVVEVAAGDGHTCALREDGTLWCWGRNDHGQLGDGTRTGRAAPRQVVFTGDADVTSVAAGRLHTCASRTDGSAWCWGANLHRQLGRLERGPGGSRPVRALSPRRVARLRGVSRVFAGTDHTCAIDRGRARCWGRGSHGQTSMSRAGRLSASATLALGDGHSCVLDAGRARCVGAGGHGQLGPSRSRRSRGLRRMSERPVVAIAAGGLHTCWVEAERVTPLCVGDEANARLASGPSSAATD